MSRLSSTCKPPINDWQSPQVSLLASNHPPAYPPNHEQRCSQNHGCRCPENKQRAHFLLKTSGKTKAHLSSHCQRHLVLPFCACSTGQFFWGKWRGWSTTILQIACCQNLQIVRLTLPRVEFQRMLELQCSGKRLDGFTWAILKVLSGCIVL